FPSRTQVIDCLHSPGAWGQGVPAVALTKASRVPFLVKYVLVLFAQLFGAAASMPASGSAEGRNLVKDDISLPLKRNFVTGT
ncbi:MAG: hypothetical protein JJU25_17160, partial [Halomonas sp.]